ncbi:MAG: hypothetical protein KatS3mg019_0460 [Fimbriimonadales bacterium]|nr:MAG: hypothetical protein KatS3mg019_0460 [Fimbriimonadales bacterium]
MTRALRYAPYFCLLLVGLGVLGWLKNEQRRAEESFHETVPFGEPNWSPRLAALRQQVDRQPTRDAKLAALADLLTAHYREHDAPLRFRVMELTNGERALRLNAAVVVPRWYAARAARRGYEEAKRALGREVPVRVYETYIVGRSRFIGIARERDGVVEVAMH